MQKQLGTTTVYVTHDQTEAMTLGDRMRRQLAASDAPRDLILGIRPEHFEDASLVDEAARPGGAEFEAPVDVVESMGSDKYVYFTVEGERATAADLEDLAADIGGGLPEGGSNLVTRLSAESRVREGGTARVGVNLDRIHLFDPGTGRNVTLHEGRSAGVAAE